MQEYCCNFKCISKDCVDDCSEIQCQFQYDCEYCQHYDDCQAKHEEMAGDTE